MRLYFEKTSGDEELLGEVWFPRDLHQPRPQTREQGSVPCKDSDFAHFGWSRKLMDGARENFLLGADDVDVKGELHVCEGFSVSKKSILRIIPGYATTNDRARVIIVNTNDEFKSRFRNRQ